MFVAPPPPHTLNVSLLQAVAVCKVVELIAALLTVINPHGDCVHDVNPAHWWRGTFCRPHLDFVWQVVHLFSELQRGPLQRREQAPSLQARVAPVSLVTQRGAEGLAHREAWLVVSPLILCHSPDSCPPPLVVEAAQEPLPVATLTPQEPREGALELFAGARVDHGVDAAVEVSQPEDDLEHRLRGLQGREEGTWREAEENCYCCNTPVKRLFTSHSEL